MKGLQDEWKATGPVPQHRSTELWGRFRGAMDQFFARRKEHYDHLEKEQKDNLRHKEALCVRAEELSDSDDWKETAEALKALQAEWKTVGPVPRKRAEALWERFHDACDRFFTRRTTHLEESRGDREKRQTEWRERLEENVERKREQVERLRESIGRDEENVQRWEGSLARVRPGPGADELRASLEEKISDVTGRIQSKRARLDELEESIRELSAKL
jgi:DNA repair exonuclease SbcCD ATPase subunit